VSRQGADTCAFWLPPKSISVHDGLETRLNSPTELDLEMGVELSKVSEKEVIAGCFRRKPVMLIQHRGGYCALSATCTHLGAPLGEGIVVDGEVHCPWHHARFSVLTGEAVGAPAFSPLARFGTEVRDGRIFITDDSPLPLPDPPSVPSTARVVIVGAGAGGHACAQLLARSGFKGAVTVISDDSDPPYDRTFCSKQYLIGMKSRDESLIAEPELYRNDLKGGTSLRKGCKVRTLHAQQKYILLDGGERLNFDFLVLATGAEPKRPQWAGADLPNVHVLRTLRDADAIIQSSKRAKNVAIVGSSFIGLEAAASLKQRELNVHVVTREDVPLKNLLGSDIGSMIRDVHEEKGVRFHFGREVKRFDGRELILDDDSVIEADFVVLGVGVTPRTEIAAGAGLECAPAEQGAGVIVNERLETSVAGIFAIGDIARYPDPHSGERIRVEHWVHAQRQGQHVARVIMGQSIRYSDVPFFWSAHFDTGLRYLGHVGSIVDASTDGSIENRSFSRLLSGHDRQRAFVTCNRDEVSLTKEAEWDAGVR
jgi:NADPH-dependent 2,4-dienoyl-CoA reductase/sulfur reductase-like enzyme/nitrite reductase/ring-hydroxylating ferredoxin subunit